MSTVPPGLPAALQALDQALDAPRRPGIPLGNWRWVVRQRMGGVRDALVGEAAGSDDGWLAARGGVGVPRAQRAAVPAQHARAADPGDRRTSRRPGSS